MIYEIVDLVFGVENLRKFRETFKEIVFDKSDRFNRWAPLEKEVKKDASDAAIEARNYKWDWIGLVPSVLAIFVGFVGDVPLIIPATGVFVFVLLSVRRVSAEVLTYENVHKMRSRKNVKFAYVWNTAMQGLTSSSA